MTRHPAYDNEPIDWGDEPPEPPPPPTVGRSMRLGFEAAYDYLAATIAGSVLAFVLFSVPLSLVYGGIGRLAAPTTRADGVGLLVAVLMLASSVLFPSAVLLSPFVAGLYTLARNMRLHDDPHLIDIGRGARRLAGPAILLGCTQALVSIVLAGDILWMLLRPETALKLTAMALCYVAFFWLMMEGHHWPLLVEQNPGLRRVLYRGFLLAAANPFYSAGVACLTLALTVVPVVCFFAFRIGPVVLVPVSMAWGVLLACIQVTSTLELLRKYNEEANGESS
jgi:hypothetical protein